VATVAARHRGTRFVLIDAQADGPNIESVLFGQHEGAFLVGMVAALTSRSQTVGFIGGMDVPVIRAFGCGFLQGARHVNRNVTLLTDYVSAGPEGFNSPARGAELAQAQFARGADVVFAAAGNTGLGVLRSARPSGPWAIGVDVNQNAVAPGAVLTSMVKRIDSAVYASLKAGHAGHWQAGAHSMGLKEGGVDWALDSYNRALVGPEAAARVERARRDIIEGKLVVADAAPAGRCPEK
jgi:basic membrane protein A